MNNRTQAIICDDLGMTRYVINNDQTVKERIDNERNKVKDKADIIEGIFLFLCDCCLSYYIIALAFHLASAVNSSQWTASALASCKDCSPPLNIVNGHTLTI